MDGDLHDIDDLFRKAIGEHEDTPSASVWDKLDKDLDKRKVVSISRKYNKLKWVAAALFIFSTAAAMYTWKVKSEINEAINGKTAHAQRPGHQEPALPTRSSEDRKDRFSPQEKDLSMSRQDAAVPPADSSEKSVAAIPPVKRNNTTGIARTDLTQTDEIFHSDKPGNRKPANDKTINQANDKTFREKPAREKSMTFRQKEDKRLRKEDKRLQKEDEKLLQLASKTNANKVNLGQEKQEFASLRDLQSKELVITGNQLSTQPILPSTLSLVKTPSVKKSDLFQPPISSKTTAKLSAPHGSRFTLMPYYSFDNVCSRVNNGQPRFREEERKEIKDKEEIGNTHSMGLIVGYALNDKLSIESGLTVSTLTSTIKPKLIFARPDAMGNVNFRFNCSAGYSVVTVKSSGSAGPSSGDSLQALSSSSSLQYISVPLNLRYKISSGKFSFNPGIGLAANFLSSGKIDTQISALGNIEKMGGSKIEGLNSMYMNGSLSVGFNYAISKSLALTVMPTLRFGLNSINKNTPVKTVLTTYGLGAGLTFSL